MSPAKGCSSRECHCPRILPPSPRQGQQESHTQANLWESSFLTQPLPTMSILNRLLLNNIFIFIQSQWPGEEELSVILGFEHDGSQTPNLLKAVLPTGCGNSRRQKKRGWVRMNTAFSVQQNWSVNRLCHVLIMWFSWYKSSILNTIKSFLRNQISPYGLGKCKRAS